MDEQKVDREGRRHSYCGYSILAGQKSALLVCQCTFTQHRLLFFSLVTSVIKRFSQQLQFLGTSQTHKGTTTLSFKNSHGFFIAQSPSPASALRIFFTSLLLI
jgi:hypothetical protein